MLKGARLDHPTLFDHLGREDLIKEVADLILEAEPPLVIGIDGDWGSGKTSFLCQLQYHLSGSCHGNPCETELETYTSRLNEVRKTLKLQKLDQTLRRKAEEEKLQLEQILERFRKSLDELRVPDKGTVTPVVWFDAWRHQNEPVPVVTLIHQIRYQFSKGSKIGEWLKKEAVVAVESVLFSLDTVAEKVKISAQGIQDRGEKYEREHYISKAEGERLEKVLDEVVGKLLAAIDQGQAVNLGRAFFGLKASKADRESSSRLVIIIDDLDRCEAETAFRLLEGIKVYLNLRNVVFVIGLNRRMVQHHLAVLYHKDANDAGEDVGRARKTWARDYMGKILNRSFPLMHLQNLSELLESVVIRDLPRRYEVMKILCRQEEPCLPPNPRKLKAFAHTLNRFARLSNGRKEMLDANLMIIMAYFYEFHPALARQVLYQQGFVGEVLKPFCLGDPKAKEGTLAKYFDSTHDLTKGDPQASVPGPSAPSYVDPLEGNPIHVAKLISEGHFPPDMLQAHRLND